MLFTHGRQCVATCLCGGGGVAAPFETDTEQSSSKNGPANAELQPLAGIKRASLRLQLVQHFTQVARKRGLDHHVSSFTGKSYHPEQC